MGTGLYVVLALSLVNAEAVWKEANFISETIMFFKGFIFKTWQLVAKLCHSSFPVDRSVSK